MTPLAWIEAGTGDPVLFLHGIGGSSWTWRPQFDALSGTRRCIAWDMPGYGDSPPLPGPMTFPALAASVARLLDLLELDRVDLVGLSMGGQVALHTVLGHSDRVRSLVLLDTSPAFGLDGTDVEEWRRERLAPLDAGLTPADFAEDLLRGVGGPTLTAGALALAVAAMARVPAAGLRAAVECLPTHDVRHRLAEIEAPTLVVVGEFDTETPVSYAEHLAARIPDARLEIVPGAGHLTNMDRPDVVNRLIGEFL
ncbi:alpha/beta hydrolase [Streptosporangium sp. NPDC051022]|uniref:alpha/beta fold hydrolase n=1 Tax=Streptosporangium sp. NPDC051022 TaxID=3155752 RepID=UPI003434D1DE